MQSANLTGNIAYQKAATASSSYSGFEPAGAVGSTVSKTLSFSTKLEDEPWWSVDLGALHAIERIIVWNRNDTGAIGAERARPMRIETSDDGEKWTTLLYIDFCFGSLDFGKPLEISPVNITLARFVKITACSKTYLHFSQVEIFANVPKLQYGLIEDARLMDNKIVAKLQVTFDSGFFSACSGILHCILYCHAHAIVVDQVDTTKIFNAYRDKGSTADVWNHIFSIDRSIALSNPSDYGNLHEIYNAYYNHFHYKSLDFRRINPITNRYFCLSDSTKSVQEWLKRSYKFDPSKYITICYRGTDKITEVPPTDIEEYIRVAETILSIEPELGVVIQTDQKQIRDRVADHFGSKCMFFSEMPVTEGNDAIHASYLDWKHDITRLQFGQLLVAVVHLLSQSRYIVTHTGNVGIWLSLFRGSCERFYQFDKEKRLITPSENAVDL